MLSFFTRMSPRQSAASNRWRPRLERLEDRCVPSAGAIDSSFGSGGIVTTDFGYTLDAAFAVAVQTDGRIVAAGKRGGNQHDFAIARYNPDGSLDTSFDGDGKVITGFDYTTCTRKKCTLTITDDQIHGLALQPDGRIVVGGFGGRTSSLGHFALARYNSDGSLDTSFDTDGKVTTAIGFNAKAYALALQTDGKIILAGFSQAVSGGPSRITLARYNANGSLDTSFDGDGILQTNVTGRANGVILQADGRIVVAGYVPGATDTDFALMRFHSDGSLDTSFGTGGLVTTNLSSAWSSEDIANGVTLQADGKIVAVGVAARGDYPDREFVVVRYNADGTLDTTFDGDGVVRTDIGPGADAAHDVVIQADGTIVVSGVRGGDGDSYALTRYNPDGSLDTTFDEDGIVVAGPTGTSHAVTLQADGKIVAVGGITGGGDFSLARYLGD